MSQNKNENKRDLLQNDTLFARVFNCKSPDNNFGLKNAILIESEIN